MNDADLEATVRACVDELARIARDMPELSGYALAFDRGNIDSAEWESVQGDAARLRAAEAAVAARLDTLRAEHPEAMVRQVAGLVARLGDATPRLPAIDQTLVADVIACLTAWAAQQPAAHAVTWAWRVGYQLAAG